MDKKDDKSKNTLIKYVPVVIIFLLVIIISVIVYRNAPMRELNGYWLESSDNTMLSSINFSRNRFESHVFIQMERVGDTSHTIELDAISYKPWESRPIGGRLIRDLIRQDEYQGTFRATRDGQLILYFSINYSRRRPYNIEIFNYEIIDNVLIINRNSEYFTFVRR